MIASVGRSKRESWYAIPATQTELDKLVATGYLDVIYHYHGAEYRLTSKALNIVPGLQKTI